MRGPGWQRARIGAWPGGMMCWVRVERPRVPTGAYRRLDGGDPLGDGECVYRTNLVTAEGREVCVTAADVELVGEFAEEVALVPFTEWLREAVGGVSQGTGGGEGRHERQ